MTEAERTEIAALARRASRLWGRLEGRPRIAIAVWIGQARVYAAGRREPPPGWLAGFRAALARAEAPPKHTAEPRVRRTPTGAILPPVPPGTREQGLAPQSPYKGMRTPRPPGSEGY